ncbi:hypothetical protein [Photobacterium leiognathi]|uniref:hypothetical protein n=1 Tax=Photobacterium leiognathi TaxID=553611 RepID=UPI0029816730|nr:hypothetical protein [Photobacterium leiognathi]
MATNTAKINWKLSLIAGLVAGGALGAGAQYYNNVPDNQAYKALQAEHQTLLAELDHEKTLAKQLTEEKTQLMSDSTQKLTELNQQLDTQKKQLVALNQQLETIQKQQAQVKKKQQEQAKKLVVTKKKLDKEVVALKTQTKQQKEVIDNSSQLFEQKAKLQSELAAAQKVTADLKAQSKKSKKACDEFKSGDSWNWVSQKDCDKYNVQQAEVSKAEAKEMKLKQALAELSKKIGA